MPAVLEIKLLGDFHVTYENKPLTGIKTTRLQSLLAYLVLHRNVPQPRQRLAFLFWPDTSEEQARNNLRNLLHFLRRALPENGNYLIVTPIMIQWNPQAEIVLDVDAFISSVSNYGSQSELEKAIQFYSGDLLPDCYDDWVVPKREYLRELFIEALENLVRLLENGREYSQAIGVTHRLLREDPLRESFHYQLMRLYAANGERAMALHTYHTLVTLLDRELGTKPDLVIQDAYQRLLIAKEQPLYNRVEGRPNLIGRKNEWEVISSTWHNLRQGQTRFVLVKGESGIGKSRLIEEMQEWAERQGIDTTRCNCTVSERNLSYASVSTWLRSRPLPVLDQIWLIEISRLLPEILLLHANLPTPEPLTENWQRLKLLKAISIAVLKERSDLILIIEDLQWCDQESLEWLAYLFQVQADIAPRIRLLVIGSLRIGEGDGNDSLDSLLADLHHTEMITTIGLGPLNESETGALAKEVAGMAVEPRVATYLYHETEGNPLFIIEMIRAGIFQNPELTANSNLDFLITYPRWQLELHKQLKLPDKVRHVIELQLAKRSQTAQELAEIASVIGREFSYDLLACSSDIAEEDLVRSVDELWRNRIIRERGLYAYDFNHEMIRQVAYTRMSDTRRRYFHRKVADALEKLFIENLEPIYEQLAAHYEQAGLFDKAIFYYYLAAQTTQRVFANQQAIQLVQKGLRLLSSAGASDISTIRTDLQSQLEELWGDILARIGSYNEANNHHQQSLDLLDKIETIRKPILQRKIGNNFREQFFYDKAVAAYHRADELFGTPSVEFSQSWWQEWIELQLDLSLVYFYLSWQNEILKVVDRLSPVIEHYGSAQQRGRFYRRLVTVKFRKNRFIMDEETIQLSRNALGIIEETGDLVETASAYFGLGLALLCNDDLDEAEQQIHAAVELTQQTGQDLLPVCYAYLSLLHRKRNDLNTALEYAHHVLRITTIQKDPIYFAMAQSTLAWIAWIQGKLTQAEIQARDALKIWQGLPDAFPFRWIALWPLIGSAYAQGSLEKAIEAVRDLFASEQQLPPYALAKVLNSAVLAWDEDRADDSRLLLGQAIDLATQTRFL